MKVDLDADVVEAVKAWAERTVKGKDLFDQAPEKLISRCTNEFFRIWVMPKLKKLQEPEVLPSEEWR